MGVKSVSNELVLQYQGLDRGGDPRVTKRGLAMASYPPSPLRGVGRQLMTPASPDPWRAAGVRGNLSFVVGR